jgi:hypothetical protein
VNPDLDSATDAWCGRIVKVRCYVIHGGEVASTRTPPRHQYDAEGFVAAEESVTNLFAKLEHRTRARVVAIATTIVPAAVSITTGHHHDHPTEEHRCDHPSHQRFASKRCCCASF